MVSVKYKNYRIGVYLLSRPHQSHNETVEQPSSNIAWSLDELKPYNWGHKEETTSRLVGGTEIGKRLILYLCKNIKNWGMISAVELPLEEQGFPALHQAPQCRVSVPGELLMISGCENQCRLWLSET